MGRYLRRAVAERCEGVGGAGVEAHLEPLTRGLHGRRLPAGRGCAPCPGRLCSPHLPDGHEQAARAGQGHLLRPLAFPGWGQGFGSGPALSVLVTVGKSLSAGLLHG